MKNKLILGTLFLTITGFITRIIGFFYRIFLSNTLGARLLGIYQLIFPVYGICFTLFASGIQTAISKQVAEKEAAGDKQANQAWREHTRIVRGNPVRVYEGMDFRREAGHMRCADQRTKNAL